MLIGKIKPLIFCFALSFIGCSEAIKESTPPFEFESIPLIQKMKKAISDDTYLSALNITKNEIQFLASLYDTLDYQPLWINDSTLNEEGKKFTYLLKNKLALGIPATRHYDIPTSKDNFIQKELKLNKCLGLLIHDLKNGFLEHDSIAYKALQICDLNSFHLFISAKDTSDVKKAFWKLGPKDTTYQVLAKFLYSEYFYKLQDTNRYSIQSFKTDSLKTIYETAIALKQKGYLKNITTDSTLFTSALKQFQEDNQLKPDGIVGKNTALTLNESSIDRLYRVALEMDRWRSKKELPQKYIHVNLPEYMLRFYINDSLKSEHNIVIGKLGNETPQLSTSIRKIIVYPFWKVPYSISSKEILPAAQNNPHYFERHNYKIYRKDVEVDPLTVNWKKIKENAFPYVVIQQPGPKNSLGIIKFDMPNSQSIYIHDTPSKGLFSTKTRAYSHGCMRCQNPLDLAKAILERDERMEKLNPIIPDSLDSIVARGENFEIPLLQYIPIFMEYRTVVVQNEKVKIYPDIYGREGEYVRFFSGK